MPLYFISGKTVLFIHIPKTGGTSLTNCLNKLGPRYIDNQTNNSFKDASLPCNPRHFHADIYKLLLPPSIDFSFAVVRHPIERIISEYFYRRELLLDKGRSIAEINIWFKHSFNCYKDNKYYLDNHLRPQSDFILDNSTEIFKIEDGLDKPLRFLEDSFPRRNFRFPQTPAPKNTSMKEEVFLDEESLLLAKELYSKDFDLFDYK